MHDIIPPVASVLGETAAPTTIFGLDPATLAAIGATMAGGVMGAIGWLQGSRAKKETPPPDPPFSLGAAALVDSAPIRELTIEVRKLADAIREMRQDGEQRRREESEERLERLIRVLEAQAEHPPPKPRTHRT